MPHGPAPPLLSKRSILKVLAFSLCPLLVLVWSGAGSFQGNLLESTEQSTYQVLKATPTLDRLAIPELPENPSPLELGRYSYYFNCMPCHGDRGQGLTDEWRQTWVEDHQNCWGRGCHAGRPDDEGFPIPTIVPQVMGDPTLLRKYSAVEDLAHYLQLTHPPQHPGKLPAEEYLALAFYLLENFQSKPSQANTGLSPAMGSKEISIVSILVPLLWLLVIFAGLWIHERFFPRSKGPAHRA